MRVLFFGSGEFGVSSLRSLAYNHDVPLVVTQPDRPGGRGRQPRPTPIRAEAGKFNLEVLPCENVNDDAIVRRLIALEADVAVVVAFGQKIGDTLIDGIRGGCVNLHASLLPAYRGAAPIHHAILAGETKTGVTAFKLVERMDAGPVLSQRWTAINPDETTSELHDRLAGIAVDALGAAFEKYSEDPNPSGEPQDDSLATRAPKLAKSDGFLCFEDTAAALALRIRAMWSWPGAAARFVSADDSTREEVVLVRARVAEAPLVDPLPAGQIDVRRLIGTGQGLLELLEVRPAGGRIMSWQDYVNGRRVQPGDRFESLSPQ
jgi:methionyl-tRNA formyltransferase